MKIKYKYYAVINSLFELDINSNSLIISLSESDARKILRLLKKLKTNINAEYDLTDEEFITFDIYLNDYTHIKIVNNQLYVYRHNILELFIDECNLVRDIVIEKALKKNYDDTRKTIQLLNTPKPKRKAGIKLFKSKNN